MIIYAGWGLIVPVIGMLGLFAGMAISTAIGSTDDDIFLMTGAWIAGAICWPLGRWLHETRGERIVTDRKTGNTFLFNNRHALMFIKVEWWSLAFAAIFLALFFSDAPTTSRQSAPSSAQAAGQSSSLNSGPTTNQPRYATVSSIQLNIRDGPSATSRIVARMDQGFRVQVLNQTDNGWSQVTAADANGNRFQGYANSSYLTFE